MSFFSNTFQWCNFSNAHPRVPGGIWGLLPEFPWDLCPCNFSMNRIFRNLPIVGKKLSRVRRFQCSLWDCSYPCHGLGNNFGEKLKNLFQSDDHKESRALRRGSFRLCCTKKKNMKTWKESSNISGTKKKDRRHYFCPITISDMLQKTCGKSVDSGTMYLNRCVEIEKCWTRALLC